MADALPGAQGVSPAVAAARRRASEGLRRLSSYRAAVSAVLGDCLAAFRWPLAFAVLVGALGLGAQLSSLGLILHTLRNAAAGRSPLPAAWAQDFSTNTFIAAIAVACTLLFLSADLHYRAQRMLYVVMNRYERHLQQRILDLVVLLPLPGQRTLNHLAQPPRLARELAVTPRQVANFVRRVVTMVVPSVQALGAVVALFSLDPLTTLVVLAAMAAASIALYQVNAGTIALAHDQESLAAEASAAHRRHGAMPTAANPDDPALVRARRGYYESLLVIDRGRLVVAAAAAAVFSAVLASKGHALLRHHVTIGTVVAYVIALHYFAAGLRSLAGTATALNRQYPWVRRLATLYSLPRLTPRRDGAFSATLHAEDLAEGGAKRLVWRAGTRVAVVLPRAGLRAGLAPLMDRLVVSGGCGAEDIDWEGSRPDAAVQVADVDVARAVAPGAIALLAAEFSRMHAEHFLACEQVLVIAVDGSIVTCTPAWAARERERLLEFQRAHVAAAATSAPAAQQELDDEALE